jgi:hypothetical protein
LTSRDAGYARAIGHVAGRSASLPGRVPDLADELARRHGNCWLAGEITVIAAMTAGPWRDEGAQVRHRMPFDLLSYRALWQQIRRHSGDTGWWQRQFDAQTAPLARATWCLALLAVAGEPAVAGNLDRLEAGVAELPADLRDALVMSSSRLGYAAVGRQLNEDVLRQAGNKSVATALLLSHHAAPGILDLPGLTDRQVVEMAAFGRASWPGLHVLSARMLSRPSEQLLDGLRAYGPAAFADLAALPPSQVPHELLLMILDEPARYPLGWVSFAAQQPTGLDLPLVVEAARAGWFSGAVDS